MRGLALPVTGIIMIIMSIIFVAVLGFSSWTQTRSITYRGDIAFSFVNDVEGLRHTVNGEAGLAAMRAGYDIGLEDKDFSTPPSFEWLATRMSSKMAYLLPEGEMAGSAAERSITFRDANVTFSIWGGSAVVPDYVPDTNFTVKGTQNFMMSDSRIDATGFSNVSFHSFANSSYFKLASIARKMLTNESWRMEKGRVTATSLTAGSYFSVKGVMNTETQENCKSIRLLHDATDDGTYYYLPVNDMLNLAIMCGSDSVDGLASGYGTGESSSAIELNLQQLQSTLDTYYPGLTWSITADVNERDEYYGDYTIHVNITDPNSFAPLKPDEVVGSGIVVGAKQVPWANLKFNFRISKQWSISPYGTYPIWPHGRDIT